MKLRLRSSTPWAFAIALILLPACASTGGPASSQTAPPEARCVSPLDVEIADSLRRLEGEPTPPSRSGMAHFTFPENEDQYQAFNHLGILAVRLFTRDRKELPLTRIYFVEEGTKAQLFALPPVLPGARVREVHPDQAEIRAKLGTHEQTAFAFVPLWLLQKKGEIAVRFAKEDQVLTLARTPIPVKLGYRSRVEPEDPRRVPRFEELFPVLDRVYCLFSEN